MLQQLGHVLQGILKGPYCGSHAMIFDRTMCVDCRREELEGLTFGPRIVWENDLSCLLEV